MKNGKDVLDILVEEGSTQKMKLPPELGSENDSQLGRNLFDMKDAA